MFGHLDSEGVIEIGIPSRVGELITSVGVDWPINDWNLRGITDSSHARIAK
jgi:hypothetical protein